jgi:hypothetical protein
LIWKEIFGNQLFVYWRGELIYKRWLKTGVSVIHDLYGPAIWNNGFHLWSGGTSSTTDPDGPS